jgi:acetylornithine deacetylase/succinyl-diaminopimelate desuccinylase-like protein
MEIAVVKKGILEVVRNLSLDSKVQEALAFLKGDQDTTMKDQMDIAAIPAPTFDEAMRGAYYKSRLEELGLENVVRDAAGNVYGIRRGTERGPTLVVFAHLDTVFPLDTHVRPEVRNGKVYGPSIADDSRGLASILTILRAFDHSKLTTVGNLIIGATVCEEGLGDLQGVKAFCAERRDVDGFIALEPGQAGQVTYECTGSRRYKVTYQGPGGHSFNDFGKPSSIHALGRAIAAIADLQVPPHPKTTFTVGVVQGGSSVNSLAAEAEMLIDLRSTAADSLLKIEEQVLELVQHGCAAENDRWNSEMIAIQLERVGDRPAGSQEFSEAIVQTAVSSARVLELTPTTQGPKGTDANVPLSLGIPAITLGSGGDFGGVHSLGEWFDPTNAYQGPQQILLTILGLVGLKGVSQPLLQERKCNE